MNITRHNYEEYFLLYVDNELSIAQRKAVESFVEANPDLRLELTLLQQSILPADDQVLFTNKQSLLKAADTPNTINETNCEEYFILYADDELSQEQKDQVEQFVYRNPQHQASFELFQQVRLMPDTAVSYPDKYALYRQEENEKAPVIRLRWWRPAAAAAVLLLIGGMSWYIVSRENVEQPGHAIVLAGTDTQATKKGAPERINQEPAQNNQGHLAEAPATPATPQLPANNLAIRAMKKDGKKQVIAPAAGNNRAVELASRQPKEPKINDQQRNIPGNTDVPLKEDVALKPLEVNKTTMVDQTSHHSVAGAVNPGDMATLTNLTVKGNPLTVNNEMLLEDEEDNYSTNDNKKNRMRGFFRKVTRVFDKATNADADQERSSIRIASFEIALK